MKKAKIIREFLNTMFSEPLEGESLEFYIDTLKTRASDESSQIEKLKEECMFYPNNKSHLLLGHRGCGKSTELNKLIDELERKNYPIYKINCIEEIDIYNIDKNDILFLLADSLIKVAKKINIDIPNSLSKKIDDFFKDIEIITEKTSEKEINAGTGIESSTGNFLTKLFKLGISVKGDIKYGSSKRTIIRNKLQNHTREWLDNITELKDIIYHKSRKLPILIFEDIDKIPNPERLVPEIMIIY
jgi:GTPase SAR1 family protein